MKDETDLIIEEIQQDAVKWFEEATKLALQALSADWTKVDALTIVQAHIKAGDLFKDVMSTIGAARAIQALDAVAV